jgi:hypothetical protein
MVWAMMAAFLMRKPPLVQASVVGLSCGLFVAAAAEADGRSPQPGPTAALVVLVGFVTGGLFYLGLRAQHVAASSASDLPRWIRVVYVVVWLFSIVAALRALFGAGGFKAAAPAIVPIVLLGPTALAGLRVQAGRSEGVGRP